MSDGQISEAEIREFFNTAKRQSRGALIFGTILAILFLGYTSVYQVEPDEEAVVLRLGKYLTTNEPGLHFKLPFGVDEAIKVKTQLILQQEFGFRTSSTAGSRTAYATRGFEGESLMLTGDLNVAEVEWITQFQISQPQDFLFHTKDPIQNIRDISEAIMRRVVGDRLVNDVLTVGRQEIADEAARLTQEIFDRYEMGVRIVSIKLQDVNPPDPVKPSFNEVNAAKQEQEQAINQAEKRYNQVIPEAKGKADESIAKAEGYAEALLNRARGDANRFTSVLKQYKKAPQITRDRLYLEVFEDLAARVDNITIIDPSLKGVLPVYGGGVTPVPMKVSSGN